MSYGCLIAKSLHELNGESFFCNIMNTSGQPVEIKDRRIVGRIVTCVVAEGSNEEVVAFQMEGLNKKVRFEERKRSKLHIGKREKRGKTLSR
jgi:hypothetical protein